MKHEEYVPIFVQELLIPIKDLKIYVLSSLLFSSSGFIQY